MTTRLTQSERIGRELDDLIDNIQASESEYWARKTRLEAEYERLSYDYQRARWEEGHEPADVEEAWFQAELEDAQREIERIRAEGG